VNGTGGRCHIFKKGCFIVIVMFGQVAGEEDTGIDDRAARPFGRMASSVTASGGGDGNNGRVYSNKRRRASRRMGLSVERSAKMSKRGSGGFNLENTGDVYDRMRVSGEGVTRMSNGLTYRFVDGKEGVYVYQVTLEGHATMRGGAGEDAGKRDFKLPQGFRATSKPVGAEEGVGYEVVVSGPGLGRAGRKLRWAREMDKEDRSRDYAFLLGKRDILIVSRNLFVEGVEGVGRAAVIRASIVLDLIN